VTRPPDPQRSTFDLAQSGEPVLDRLVEEHLPQLRAFVRAHMAPDMRARESAGDIVQTVCRALIIGHLRRRGHIDDEGALDVDAALPWTPSAPSRQRPSRG